MGQQKFLVLLGEGGSEKSIFIRLMESSVGSRHLSNISLTKNNFYKSLRAKGYKDFKTGGYRYFKGISDEKSSPIPAPDGFIEIPEGIQEELPFD